MHWQESVREAAQYLSLGMQLALTMVVCSLGGFALDRALNTEPWLLVTGAFLGMACVMARVIFLARQGT